MNILHIHRHFYILGGSEKYLFGVTKMLEKGNNISYFSTIDKKNIYSKWNGFFIHKHTFNDKSIIGRLNLILNNILSFKTNSKLEELIDKFKPDIVHIHTLDLVISASILPIIRRKRIPIVQTLHDYNLISPSSIFYHNGKICEISKKTNYFKSFFHKCVWDSYFASAVSVIGKYFHMILKYYDNIDVFIAPSDFIRNKMMEYGYSKDIITTLPYFTDITLFNDHKSKTSHNYILYFGRLVPEKGLKCLLEAVKKIPGCRLYVVGNGSAKYVIELKNSGLKSENIKFLPFQNVNKLVPIINNSRFTVLPSVWYEVFGITILESFACGKPVIASNIGGIPEIVKDGYNGLLFEPGNVNDLSEKINKLWNNPLLCKKLGVNARKYVEKYYNPEDHYNKLMRIYNKAIKKYRVK
jgi:glycosyltransferase involved in cell wall biosynthesis